MRRVFALLIVVLAASPMTAPFTASAFADLVTPHSATTPHPGSQIALPHGKAASLLVALSSQVAAVRSPAISGRLAVVSIDLRTNCKSALQRILRV